jgi:hypothetical protein
LTREIQRLVFASLAALYIQSCVGPVQALALSNPPFARGAFASACLGDCNGDGEVTVDELIRGVNIALGSLPLSECPVFDGNEDGSVTVDELITAVNNALSGCPPVATATPTATPVDVRTPTVLSGVIEVESFTLEAGELAVVTGDVTIRASGAVRIDGDLRASDAGGQNIAIEAGGDVEIGGTISAGNGAAAAGSAVLEEDSPPFGKGGSGGIETAQIPLNPPLSKGEVDFSASASNGGSVVIQSAGDIDVGAFGRLAAGDGADGGDGGDVVLHAPNGTITIPNREDVIHVGNGGDGQNLNESPSPEGGQEQQENRGGDSGLLLMNAQAVVGVEAETVTIREAFSPVGTNLVFGAREEVFTIASMVVVSGGRGGNAGSFTFGESEQLRFPLPLSAFPLPLAEGQGEGIRPVFRFLAASPSLTLSPVVRRGADGGDGFLFGGSGADVTVIGISGFAGGANGQSVMAIAGDGGGCLRTYDQIFCTPGSGGDAEAQGGNGGDGSEPGGAGGQGGDATAIGGNSADDPDNPEESSEFGPGGDATALAGFGGFGGDDCPSNGALSRGANRIGGPGGNGGNAAALGGNSLETVSDALRGLTVARGGAGGDGGDGEDAGGPEGIGGLGQFLRERNVLKMASSATNGGSGQAGALCATPSPTPSETEVDTPTPTRTRTRTPTATADTRGPPCEDVDDDGFVNPNDPPGCNRQGRPIDCDDFNPFVLACRCADLDSDGFVDPNNPPECDPGVFGLDCDDMNVFANPLRGEICNGFDDDCDGDTDEADSDIVPGPNTVDLCGDGIDQDCSGEADEECECAGFQVTIAGSNGDDVLMGTPDFDVIHGRAGNDMIDGTGGDDLICAGTGDDNIRGGDGADTLLGQDGVDTLFGENGNDGVNGGDGNDMLFGGDGDDFMFGDGTAPFGEPEPTGNDFIDGGAGNDTVGGDLGNDMILGGTGNDSLTGDAGNDEIHGGPDDDALFGGEGADQLFGEDGNDRLIGGGDGPNQLNGGPGFDQCSESTAADVKVDCER